MGKAPPSRRSSTAARVPEAGCRSAWARGVWLPGGILLVGAVLRIVYAAGSDVRNVYDDHFQVARIMLDERRWPHPDDNWEAYQPPLYHALSALTYWAVSGHSHTPVAAVATSQERTASQSTASPPPWHVRGRKAIQFISVASGIGTLVLVWLTLRLLFPETMMLQAVGLAAITFLPRHVYMSGMATNDVMAWLWSSLCVYALLRALPPRADPLRPAPMATHYGGWTLAGVAAALAMWTKHYGLGSLAVIGVLVPAGIIVRERGVRRAQARGAVLALLVALALGVWPYVRTYRLTGSPIVSPFTRLRNTMGNQLPGEVSQVSWTSFRLVRLLRWPWVHIDTVDSFWTSVYGEAWFDFGTSVTAYQYRPWLEFLRTIFGDRTLSNRERERRGLTWDTSVMPVRMLWEGRALIALGLGPTVVCALGVGAIWKRMPTTTIGVVLMTSALVGVATPLFQTVRQPFRSSMKASFALSALSALAVFFAAGYAWLSRRRGGPVWRALVLVNVAWLAVAVVWHFLDLALVFPHCAEYVARRDRL